MSGDEVNQLEVASGFPLPEVYRHILQHYPFDKESMAALLLTNDLNELLSLNCSTLEVRGITHPWFIGSSWGDEYFMIDADDSLGPVYEFDIETATQKLLHPTLDEWVAFIHQRDNSLRENPIALTFSSHPVEPSREVFGGEP